MAMATRRVAPVAVDLPINSANPHKTYCVPPDPKGWRTSPRGKGRDRKQTNGSWQAGIWACTLLKTGLTYESSDIYTCYATGFRNRFSLSNSWSIREGRTPGTGCSQGRQPSRS
jgi:hypothetical protein